MLAMDLQKAVASEFSAQLNSTFQFHHEGGPTELELIEVSDGSRGDHVNFSLLFQGPPQPPLIQRIYPVEHEKLGRFELFIVPIKREARGLQYEAIFNRLSESSQPST